MNVVAYTRVSTDGQCGDDRYGLEAQKADIREYCKANGMNIVRWFSDEGESGAKYRPGFDEIIYGEAVSNPPYEAVVVAKSDRVARDINIYFYYKACLARKDMKLISISEDFGQFGVFAPMLESFVVCMAQMERENIKNRTSSGRKIKAAKGGYSGGRAPMGYHVEAGSLVIEPREAHAVRRIFELHNEGHSLRDIASILQSEGLTTRSGSQFKASTLKGIIDNERTYRGEYRYGKEGKWVKGEHEPILM